MARSGKWIWTGALIGVVLTGALAGCKPKSNGGGSGGGMEIPVVAAEAKQQVLTESLSLVGTIAANEYVEVKSEMDGIVQEVLFREGEQVERGQLLVRLDDTKLAASLAESESSFRLSKANFDRAQQLFRDKLISQQEYDQAAATFDVNQATLDLKRRQLKDTRIYAPFAGTVGARFFSPGQVISRNTTLTLLVDTDPVKVEFHVPERFLSQVRVGQEIQLAVAAYPERRFSGQVYFVAPGLDPATRTALVKAELPNPGQELRPGMFANLNLALKVRDAAIVIPESALVLAQDRTSVFVIGADATVQPRAVSVGLRMPGRVEITEGLQSGERVVIEGIQKVRPGGKVRDVAATPASAS